MRLFRIFAAVLAVWAGTFGLSARVTAPSPVAVAEAVFAPAQAEAQAFAQRAAILSDPCAWANVGAKAYLALDFQKNRACFAGSPRGPPSNVPGWSFTRASVATAEDLAGNVYTFASGVPRITDKGLLVEESRTNVLLNSQTLSTQSVSVTAQAYTLSFKGTGTVTLTGASTAGPLAGTGANNRVSLTFTPSAGTLTLTVSGTVSYANLEAGSFATSWVPTAGSSATRAADAVSVGGLTIPTNGASAAVAFIVPPTAATNALALEGSGLAGASLGMDGAGTRVRAIQRSGSARGDSVSNSSVVAVGQVVRAGVATDGSTALLSINGVTANSSLTPSEADWSSGISLGSRSTGSLYLNSYLQRAVVFNRALSQAELNGVLP